MIATSGFLIALECIKFVFGRRRRSAPDATGSGVFAIRPLGPCPPLNSEKFLHMTKSATLQKFHSQENSKNCCHQMSYFKAKMHQI